MLGKKLKELREENEISQPQLAEKLHVSNAVVSYWENDKNEPKATYIARMAKFFDVTADYLLGLEDEYGIKKVDVKKSDAGCDAVNSSANKEINLPESYYIYNELSIADKVAIDGIIEAMFYKSHGVLPDVRKIMKKQRKG